MAFVSSPLLDGTGCTGFTTLFGSLYNFAEQKAISIRAVWPGRFTGLWSLIRYNLVQLCKQWAAHVQRELQCRRAFHKALSVPGKHLDQLWRAYEDFEKSSSINPQLARKELDEQRPRYQSAKSATSARNAMLRNLDVYALALPPGRDSHYLPSIIPQPSFSTHSSGDHICIGAIVTGLTLPEMTMSMWVEIMLFQILVTQYRSPEHNYSRLSLPSLFQPWWQEVGSDYLAYKHSSQKD